MTELCFGDGDVFVDLYLLIFVLLTIFSINNKLGPFVTEENIL